MGSWIAQQLVGEFIVFGVHFQNWMALAAIIVALWMLFLWVRGSFGGRH